MINCKLYKNYLKPEITLTKLLNYEVIFVKNLIKLTYGNDGGAVVDEYINRSLALLFQVNDC